MLKLILYALSAITILFVIITIILLSKRKITVPFLYRVKAGYDYSIGTLNTKNPLQINKESINFIDPKEFDIHPSLRFMADPFIVEEKGIYYIFYEECSTKMNSTWGDIAAIKSTDLKKWTHLGVVLNEKFHLSYPHVFKWNEKWYMIPESGAANDLRLYESDNFPFNWKLKNTLIPNKEISDATIIIKDNYFYILALSNKDLSLVLYISDNLFSNWKEHPSSPIRTGFDKDIRPAGCPGMIDDKLYYFIQDHTCGYGTGVIAYSIDSLSPTSFKDTRLIENPILYKFGNASAANGMHQLSWIKTDEDNYFCVVDGAQYHENKWGWDWKNLPEFKW